jgi:hypothetical protein
MIQTYRLSLAIIMGIDLSRKGYSEVPVWPTLADITIPPRARG